MKRKMVQIQNGLVITAAILFSASAGQAGLVIPVNGGWDVNFNGDTVGSAPSVVSYDSAVLHTTPNRVDGNTGNTVLVQSSLGGLTDQPVVLTSTVPQSSLPSLQFGFDSTAGPNQSHSAYEWDVLVDSTGAAAGATKFFSFRLLAGGGALAQSIHIRNDDVGGGELSMWPDFASAWTIWNGDNNDLTIGTVNNVRVEIDRIAETASWYLNNKLFVLSTDPGLKDVGTIQFRDIGGLGGSPQTFVIGIDNFKGGIIPEPSSLVLLALGAAAIGLVRRRQV
jgi:hypothetical protein